MIVLPRTTAGANRDTNASRGYSVGQAIPMTPTGSLIRTVHPYRVVSYKRGREERESVSWHSKLKLLDQHYFPSGVTPCTCTVPPYLSA